MKILYFGNPYLKEDSLAIKICNSLKGDFPMHEFKQIKDTFELIEEPLENSIIIDVAQGISKVSQIEVSKLKQNPINTTHDFDLSFFLKLTKKNPIIIAIPLDYEENKAFKEVKDILISFPTNF